MCLQHLLRIYKIFQATEVYLAAEEIMALQQAIVAYQLHYTALARLALNEGRMLWSLVPKHHFITHIGEQSAMENSRLFWCYSGEDTVGKLSALGHQCISGKPMHEITPVLLSRYRISVHLKFQRMV